VRKLTLLGILAALVGGLPRSCFFFDRAGSAGKVTFGRVSRVRRHKSGRRRPEAGPTAFRGGIAHRAPPAGKPVYSANRTRPAPPNDTPVIAAAENHKEARMRFSGKHLVIIGGSSGIGLETTRLALAEGATVTVAGRSADRLRRAAEYLESRITAGPGTPTPVRLRSVVADVSDEASIRDLFAAEPRVDHVFLPAGELRPGAGDALGPDTAALRATLEVRLLGVGRVVRHARPKMAGGSITLMSGQYATHPAKGGSMAAAAVAGVEGMTRALALDLAPIRVNAVSPGLIETPLWDAFGAQREEILARAATLPVGRAGRPEEVAEAVLFLMGNGFVTGTVLAINGGGGLV
jgi:NAD(P)-dependent dehydrogenase (short-subunit alcohol dehydrogenase family)